MNKSLGYVLILLTMTIACKSETKQMEEHTNTVSDSDSYQGVSVEKLAGQLKQVLIEKGFTIMAHIDHAAGAEKVSLELRPTQTLIFGNPKGGTLLMQQSQEIGIDLPLKIVIWQDEAQEVHASYYNATALTTRYGIFKVEELIAKIDGMFKGVTGNNGKPILREQTAVQNQLITKHSALNVEDTFAKLKQVVSDKGLQIMAEVPHDKAAQKVNLELRPTRVLIFGNPKVGTLLMQSNQEMGLDLPLKILVHENERGETLVSYYDATFLTKRYGITDKDEVVKKINAALEGITSISIVHD